MWVLLSKTRLGNAIRSVAQDREIANLMGIDVSRICLIVMGISGMLAGIAGVIAAFILGFAETAVIYLVPGGGFLRGAVSLSVMVVVLMVRPEGLFGVLFEEERL